jgi:acetylornithine deacetylase/succinyl-diaminopimelate desuccinylase-like protein
MRKLAILSALFGIAAVGICLPASGDDHVLGLERRRAILREFVEFLVIPNVASDRENIRRNAEHLARMMKARGIETRLLETEGGPPVVYGELRSPGTQRTLLVYAHYDGQPVDLAAWTSDPWKPALRSGTIAEGGRVVRLEDLPADGGGEWRLYGRGTSDDKGTIMAVLAALDVLKERRALPVVNVKFLFEGEEESGSAHLEALLRGHASLFRADGMLLCDGPVHQTRRPQLVFGARGVLGLEMTVYGPDRALHSGHYGNWAPNPAAVLANLLASLRDTEGKILVPGFYDDVRPLVEAEKNAIRAVPPVDDELRRQFGLSSNEAGGTRLEERIMLPALNIRGLSSGNVGPAAQNAIPTEATASIDFRLVPGQSPAKVRERVEAFIRTLGYEIVHEEPTEAERRQAPKFIRMRWGEGYPAYREPLDAPFSRALMRTLDAAAGGALVRMPALGGSIPMEMFARTLGLPIVLFPIANHDNNQHGPDENIRLRNLWDGVEMHAALLAGLAAHWKD